MKIEEHIQYWVESADHDLDSSESLFAAGKYDWSLFIGHLVLEKILKALYVQDNQNQLPPKTHNFIKNAPKILRNPILFELRKCSNGSNPI